MTVHPQPRMSTLVRDVEFPGDLDERRREGVRAALTDARARAEGTGSDPDWWLPPVGLCRYGPGCVALALVGPLDRAGFEGLRTATIDLHRDAVTELIIDCSQLPDCTPTEARLLAGLRIRSLSAGARVELRGAPPALVAELGQQPAQAFLVADDTTRTR